MQPAIRHRAVWCLGVAQLVNWGITYYLIGGFGAMIAADTGWSQSAVYGGFSTALLLMGLSSPLAGRLIDRFGGRRVMNVGAVLNALGCACIALSRGLVAYYAAWACLGLAMRLTLYEAAFAALARIGGPEAKRPISQITLLGGLASSVFWPVGQFLAGHLGWRGALFCYAGFALLTVPLHLMLPDGAYRERQADAGQKAPQDYAAQTPRARFWAGALFAVMCTLIGFLNAGMSAHTIGILSGLGLPAAVAVQVASLRGVGQSSARLAEILLGKRLHPLNLNVGATLLLPISFAAGLLGGKSVAAAVVFSLFYGIGNGLSTITRGTVPLALFGHQTYGALVGALLAPSFLLSAAAPLIFSFVIEHLGSAGALVFCCALTGVAFLAALALRIRFFGQKA